ncbi:hypothetical protein [Peribacillus simplex]|uniref:hypothetical protein n=1 Tax=Peribacillus simplex TaxID=1478 RepID=UPI00333DD306
MDWLIAFIKNSWTVSIITGLVVYWMTKWWEKVRSKKQYFEAVTLASKEVFNTIKFCIPEETLPNIHILKALHSSTAKKYNVKSEDMDTLNIILYDLIKEIMDSNFLSYDNKIIYCNKLEILEGELTAQVIPDNETKINIPLHFNMSISARSSFISAAFALTSSIVVFLIRDYNLIPTLTIDESNILPLLLFSTGIIVIIMLLKLFLKFRD